MAKASTGTILFAKDSKTTGVPFVASNFDDGEPKTILRELIQNSTDAFAEKKNALSNSKCKHAHIEFKLVEVDSEEIPCWREYREKVALMCNKPHPTAKEYIETIHRAAKKDKQQILFVSDNGIGLTKKTLAALLSEGTSEKQKGASGSFGIGHFTAFSASTLNYILYASKNKDDGILGSGCVIGTSFADKGMKHSYIGNIFDESQGQESLFDADTEYKYLERNLPNLLQNEVDSLDDTGTIVAIAGFDWFNYESKNFEKIVDQIFTVLATQFTVALLDNKLSATVIYGDQRETLDKDKLPLFLRDKLEKTQSDEANELYFALECIETFALCKRQETNSCLINLDSPFNDCLIMQLNQFQRQIISVWRNGMLIKAGSRLFSHRYFKSRKNFSAMLILDGSKQGETLAHDLMRSAEVPTHDDFQISRIKDKKKERKFNDFLKQARECMLKQAIEYSEESMEIEAIEFPSAVPVEERLSRSTEKGTSSSRERDSKSRQKNKNRTHPNSKGGTQRLLDFRISGGWTDKSWRINLLPLMPCDNAALSLELSRGQDAACDSMISLNKDVLIYSAELVGDNGRLLEFEEDRIFLGKIEKQTEYEIKIEFKDECGNKFDAGKLAFYPMLVRAKPTSK